MKVLISLLGVIGLITSMKCIANEYHYDNYGFDAENWKLPRSFYFNLKDSYMLDPTNEYSTLTVCKEKPACITSEQFNFSLPSKEMKSGVQWVVANNRYTIKQEVKLQILGVVHDVHLIEMIVNDHLKYQYFYSKKSGLVAFTISSLKEDDTEMYILREKHGIGAEI